MVDTLINIYKKTEKELKAYVTEELAKQYKSIVVGDGFVFAKGDFPVLLVAHLDTVHKETPKSFVYSLNGDVISSPQGIGGDDRNGVFSALEVSKRYNCSVLFCEQEEMGGVGAEKFIETELAKGLEFNYIIEFDRKGSKDAVFYDCDNPEFTEFITKNFYKEEWGTFSDISILAPYLGCAAVNLSCGYYKPHTKDEYVVVSEMVNSINAACDILARTTDEDKFEYIETTCRGWYGRSGHYGGWYDDGYDDFYDIEDKYYIIEYSDEKGKTQWYDVMAMSEAEAVGKFVIDNPNTTYNDVIFICAEKSAYAK
jgi:hypothetical protein